MSPWLACLTSVTRWLASFKCPIGPDNYYGDIFVFHPYLYAALVKLSSFGQRLYSARSGLHISSLLITLLTWLLACWKTPPTYLTELSVVLYSKLVPNYRGQWYPSNPSHRSSQSASTYRVTFSTVMSVRLNPALTKFA